MLFSLRVVYRDSLNEYYNNVFHSAASGSFIHHCFPAVLRLSCYIRDAALKIPGVEVRFCGEELKSSPHSQLRKSTRTVF